ncbi:MAG TPA: ABC transporter permease, partial [Mobilitalea sp.]|nr:ABC transporter permease [Mobilitalea sp.]
MQVFKTYFKIFKKQWVSIIVYVFLFIGVTMTFTASLLKENDKQFSAEKVPILVINKDNESDLVQGLLNYLGRKADFVQVADNEMARKDALFYQKIVYILTIPEGFTDSFIKGGNVNLVKQTIPDATASYSVDTAVDNYLNTARIYVKQFPGISQKELVSYVDDTLK